MKFFSKMKQPGTTVAGVFSLALASVVLLCGAGAVPIENFSPQGAMQADLNAGGHNVTNVATMSASNVVVSGSVTAANLGSAATNAASAFAPASGSTNYVAIDLTGHATLPAPFSPAIRYSSCPGIIIDSDFCGDRDDCLAFLEAAQLQAQGECRIIGAIADLKNPYSAPAISATLTACGLGNIPVGTMIDRAISPSGTVGQSVATSCPNSIKQNNGLLYSEDSTTLYRRLLANAPASSVKIVCIGGESAIYLLEQSAADSISPLTGLQLINQKVIEIDVMGGAYPSSTADGPSGNPEYNFSLDPAADGVFATVSVRVNFIGYQMGFTPASDYCTALPPSTPAYVSRVAKESNSPIFDPVAVLYAVRGLAWGGTTYFTATTGTNAINTSTGANTFTAGAGTEAYLSYATSSSAVDPIIQTLVTYASMSNPANPFSLLADNNAWTGTETFSGTTSFTGTATFSTSNSGMFYLQNNENPALVAGNATTELIRTAEGSSNYAVLLFAHGTLTSNTNDWSIGTRGSDTSNFYLYRESGTGSILVPNGNLTLQAGAFDTAATQTTINGSTGGTAVFSEPFQGTSFKEIVVFLNNLSGTASYTFPAAFTNTPVVMNSDAAVTSISTTAVTVTGSGTTRAAILEGY